MMTTMIWMMMIVMMMIRRVMVAMTTVQHKLVVTYGFAVRSL